MSTLGMVKMVSVSQEGRQRCWTLCIDIGESHFTRCARWFSSLVLKLTHGWFGGLDLKTTCGGFEWFGPRNLGD